MTDEGVVLVDDQELAPEPPPKGPRIWLRDNLFSTPASGVMTVISIVIVLFAYRGLLNFVFDPLRRWDAVTFNMKLLMVQAYPGDEMWRVWLSVGIVFGLLAASLAMWRLGGMAEPRRIGAVLMGVGGAVILGGLLGPFNSTDVVPPNAPAWISEGRIWWFIVGAVLMVIGYALRAATGERAKESIIPIMGLVGVLIVLGLAVIWVVDVPVPAKIVDGQAITDGAEAAGVRAPQVKVFRPVAESTTIPWTLIAVVSVIVYVFFRLVGGASSAADAAIKRTLTVLWVLAFPVLVLILLRKPEWDWAEGATVHGLGFLVMGAIGSLLLWWMARPGTGEVGRVVAGFLLLLAFASLFIPMPFVWRFMLLALALFALAAPSFGGDGSRGLIVAWLITVFLVAFFVFTMDTDSGIDVPGSFFLGGLSLTIVLAFTSIVLSFPLGVILALGRTSTMPIFRLLCTAYIELVRGVPLITWLLVAFLMLPVALPEGIEIGGVLRAIGAMTFFSAAYLAENVRGGLQSIPAGQKEASRALGMSTIQMIVFITLPQALRAVIPALVGQVIALFKDTSLVTIVGLFDFLHIARQIIPAQSQPFSFLGSIKETLIFAAVVYWLFTFTFSRISLRLEKRLGVGER
ncbi:MAG: amino acid ABC transporter permease [Acidimicrobiia bacterium]|nr:amino acid ABC transporter permease [Acidimicrobiia bacterium]